MGSRSIYVLVLILSALGSGLILGAETSRSQYFLEVEANSVDRYNQFESKFRRFIQLVDTSLELRRDAKSLLDDMDRKLSGEEHLTAEEQQAIRRDFARFRENRDSFEQIISEFDVYTDEDVEFRFPTTSPSRVVEDAGILGLGDNTELLINPNDDLGRLMILESKMWLAAKLIVVDNYVVTLLRYRKNDDSRRQFDLDTIDPEAKIFLEDVAAEILDGEKYERIVKSIELVQQIIGHESNNQSFDLIRDKDGSYLSTLIEGSYAYHRIPELTISDRIAFDTDSFENAFLDDVVSIGDAVTHEISESFGNTIGMYEERKGKLFQMSLERQNAITDKLELLDVLFEKTPFRLTDQFIPGHWGHVAIWVGDKNDITELERLGVWEELPGIEAEARANLAYEGPSFQSLIEQGHGVLEALRAGVELNAFASFLNIDDLAVIRDGGMTDAQKKKYLLTAFAQVGKEYDFNFDVETSNRIVCSELAFVVYDDYDWPVGKSVGRYTVSPDHVAALALEEGDPFTPILIFHDGQELPGGIHRVNLKNLLEGSYDEIVFK